MLDWLASEGITHLAIHFDVDVLDPRTFGPVLFNGPEGSAEALADVPRGRMTPAQVVRLLRDVAAASDVVGLAITEYLPWEALAARDLLRKLPLLGGWRRPDHEDLPRRDDRPARGRTGLDGV